MSYTGLHTVISGGQTGADQGGLIAGYRAGLITGGTAPSNFYTQDGPNPMLECLGLTSKGDYRSRTCKNVHDSDGTVLLSMDLNSPGSNLTRNEALRTFKPFLEYDISEIVNKYPEDIGEPQVAYHALISPISIDIHRWLIDNNVGVLNVAGNRERHKGMHTTYTVCAILTHVFNLLDVDDLLIRKL